MPDCKFGVMTNSKSKNWHDWCDLFKHVGLYYVIGLSKSTVGLNNYKKIIGLHALTMFSKNFDD